MSTTSMTKKGTTNGVLSKLAGMTRDGPGWGQHPTTQRRQSLTLWLVRVRRHVWQNLLSTNARHLFQLDTVRVVHVFIFKFHRSNEELSIQHPSREGYMSIFV